jgi:hypothetical protein
VSKSRELIRIVVIAITSLSLFSIILTPVLYANQVTLYWDQVVHPHLAGYVLHYGTHSRDYDASVDVGTLTRYTIVGLEEGQVYYFAVTAYGIHGEKSDFSNEVVSTGIDPTISPPPGDLDYIEIVGSASVNENSIAQQSCKAHYTDGTNRLVEPDTWHVDCSYASISTAGILTTYDVDSDQACQISASYTDGGITSADTHEVTLLDSIKPPPGDLDYIEIKGPIDVNENSTADYDCRAYYTDGTNKLVEPDTWNVDCPFAGILATGLLTTHELSSDKPCQVSASYQENGIASSDAHSISIRDTRSDTDSDGDSVPDTQDNCPNTYNPDRADSDGNGIGNACESVGNALIRVNAGGGDYVDGNGNIWSADYGYNTGIQASTQHSISDTAYDILYKTERWDRSSSPELQYTFNVPTGNYTVNLHFADFYDGTAGVGLRVFDVLIEGELVLDDLDIYREVGHDAALIKSFSVAVTDGQLNIEFLREIQDPKISAIEILNSD